MLLTVQRSCRLTETKDSLLPFENWFRVALPNIRIYKSSHMLSVVGWVLD